MYKYLIMVHRSRETSNTLFNELEGVSACAIGGSNAAAHCHLRTIVAKQKENSFYLSVVLKIGAGHGRKQDRNFK